MQLRLRLRLAEIWLDKSQQLGGTGSLREVPRNRLEKLSVRLLGYRQVILGGKKR